MTTNPVLLGRASAANDKVHALLRALVRDWESGHYAPAAFNPLGRPPSCRAALASIVDAYAEYLTATREVREAP